MKIRKKNFNQLIKKSAFIISMCSVASCTSIGLKDNLGSSFALSNIWVNSFSKIIYGYPDYPLSREMVENIPYASMRVKIGKGPAGLMILQEIKEDTLSWVSKDEVLLQTKNGRIIRTSKLNNDLVDYYYDNDLSFKALILNKNNYSGPEKSNLMVTYIKNFISKDNYKKNTYTSSRVISLSNPKVRHLELTVNTSISPDLEKVVILDKEFYLLKIIENIENNQIKWKYSNYYWVDPNDGVVWKSIQKIAPNVPEIKLEITKQPDL